MDRLLVAIAGAVSRRPRTVLLAVLATTVLLGVLGTRATTASGDFEDFGVDTPAGRTAERITELFGAQTTGEATQLLVIAPDVISPEGVTLAAELRDRILADPAVAPVAAAVVTYADPVLGVTATTDDEIDAAYLEALASDPRAQQAALLVGGEGEGADRTAGMVVVRFRPDAPAAAIDAARQAVAALDGPRGDGVEVYATDFEVLQQQVDAAVEGQLQRLLGVAFLLIVVILVAVYRRVGDVVISLAGLVASIVWVQGFGFLLGPDVLGLTGGMSQMTMAIPILLVGLGVDYGIHLTMRAREERSYGRSPSDAAARAITAVGTALLLATITTAVGFLTNVANPLPPLRDFGVLAAVGVIGAFVVMTTSVPAARLLLEQRRRARTGTTRRIEGAGLLGRVSAAAAPLAAHRPGTVLAVAAAITALALVGATRLSTAFSQTDFFPAGSRALAAVQATTAAFGGDAQETTTVLIEADPATVLDGLVAFEQRLATLPGVRTIDGRAATDSVVARLEAAGLLDAARTDPAAALAALGQADPSLSGLVTDGATLVRIRTSAGESAAELRDAILAAAADTLPGVPVGVTSEAILIAEVLDRLNASQLRGLGITLAASMAILALAFQRRERAGLLGVLAIATVGVTAVWVLGVMAAIGIPFNVMTAMVGALAVGIGVPFGIHVVNRFLEDRASSPDLPTAVHATLTHTGGALIGSAVTTVAGFGVLGLSTVTPMRQFGIVTALTIALALVANLTILPALLVWWARRREGVSEPEAARVEAA